MRFSRVSAALLLGLAVVSPVHAVTYCVTNGLELQNALTAAAASTADDSIRLHQGIFTPSSMGFTYQSQNTGWLDISGGWRSINATPCDEQVGTAATTVVEGAGQFRALTIIYFSATTPSAGPRYTVSNFTVTNGAVFGQSGGSYAGGLQIASYVDTPTRFWVDNMIVHYNTTEYFTGGAQIYASQGEIRVVNSLFDHNSAPNFAIGQLETIMGSATASANQRVVIANNTFVNGTCAGAGARPCGVRVFTNAVTPTLVVNNLFSNNAFNDLHLEGSGPVSASNNLMATPGGTNPNFTVSSPLNGPPGFVDAAGGNFQLLETSPLVNRGIADGVPGGYYGYDLTGGVRVRFGEIDVGAYETQTQELMLRDGFE